MFYSHYLIFWDHDFLLLFSQFFAHCAASAATTAAAACNFHADSKKRKHKKEKTFFTWRCLAEALPKMTPTATPRSSSKGVYREYRVSFNAGRVQLQPRGK